jgi:ABC-type uncharacterized transport system permease subunit
MTAALLLVATACYLISAGLLAKRMTHATIRYLHHYPVALGAIIIALFTHGWALSNTLFIPLAPDFSMVNIASLLAWVMVVVLLIASALLGHFTLLPVIFAFAALCSVLMLINPLSYTIVGSLTPAALAHIILSLSAYGCVVIALLYAIQMRLIHAQLKSKSMNLRLPALPPLMEVEAWVLRLIGIGAVLLAFGLFTGFATSDAMFDAQHAHKTVLSMIALAVLFAILFVHHRWGLANRAYLILISIGVALLTLGYFGSRIVREIILSSSL